MLRSQRILLTVGLLFIAWLLHVNLCDWGYKLRLRPTANGYLQTIIWAKSQDAGYAAGWSPHAHTGPLTQANVDRDYALVYGIALPLGLVMLVIYFWLGWRIDARLRRRLCPACGYDLRGLPPASGCPECGAGR